jgi:hypothetical protein
VSWPFISFLLVGCVLHVSFPGGLRTTNFWLGRKRVSMVFHSILQRELGILAMSQSFVFLWKAAPCAIFNLMRFRILYLSMRFVNNVSSWKLIWKMNSFVSTSIWDLNVVDTCMLERTLCFCTMWLVMKRGICISWGSSPFHVMQFFYRRDLLNISCYSRVSYLGDYVRLMGNPNARITLRFFPLHFSDLTLSSCHDYTHVYLLKSLRLAV